MASAVPEAFVRRVLELLTPWDCGSELVRYGPGGDGGYLVPAGQLEQIRLVMSAGLGDSAGFEDDLRTKHDIPASIIDGSFDRPSWLASAHRFHRRWLADGTAVDRWSLDDWVEAEAPGTDDLLLQMDIEGAEYRVLDAARPATLERFRVIVVELHRFGHLRQAPAFARMAPALATLADRFVAVHLHPNNCCGVTRHGELTIPNVVEVTWLRRSALPSGWQPTDRAPIPHRLDRPNIASGPDLDLWTGWPAPAPAPVLAPGQGGS